MTSLSSQTKISKNCKRPHSDSLMEMKMSNQLHTLIGTYVGEILTLIPMYK